MELSSTIDSTFADLAMTVDQGAVAVAERLPAPVDALVLRVGAVNSEAMRQYGRVTATATAVDAVTGVAGVAWTGTTQLIDATGDAVEASTGTLRSTGRRAVGDARQASSTIENRGRAAAGEVERNFSAVADRPSGPYESWSKDELYERAQELGIDGRSTMSKNQLVKALRSA